MVAGEFFIDLLMSGFPFWPQPGQEAFSTGFHREVGGGAAITACGLAKLGASAGVLCMVGDDFGFWVAEQLRARGVDASDIRFDHQEPTAFTVVATTPEDRAFLTYPGANRGFARTLAQAAEEGRFARARHVHLACTPGFDILDGLLRGLRRSGASVSLDVGWHVTWLRDARALPAVSRFDLYFPNEAEGRALTGETEPEKMLRKFEGAGARRVALKLGACGSALLWDGEILVEGGMPVDPVDTTGAGDCFDAGFLYCWLAGAPPQVCLRAANICGALSTEAYGGIAAFPDRHRLARILGYKL